MAHRPRKSPTSAHTNTAAWRKLRAEILADHPDCAMCGLPGADELDHIIPAALGGQPTRDNVRSVHARCNRAAGARLGNALRAGKRPRLERPTNATANTNAPRESSQANRGPQPKSGVDLKVPKGSGRSRSDEPRYAEDGLLLPRLETPADGEVVGSLGPEAIEWVNAERCLGDARLRRWQEYVLERALEVREDGSLRWPVVIVSTARQQGKSYLLRALALWRLHQAERFEEEQTVLHVSVKAAQAAEVWRPAASWAAEKYGLGMGLKPDGQARLHSNMGQQSLTLPDGSRWLVAAATNSAGVGYSVSMALVDEAWSIPSTVVNSAIRPTMAARAEPQLWLISTAGDSGSDLLRSYRQAALRDPEGEVLLLEWSAPPEAAWDDPAAWRWGSPYWDDRRERFLRTQAQTVPESAFRQEMLNSWQTAVDGWMTGSAWKACAVARLARPRRKDAPVVAVGTERGGTPWAVAAWRTSTRGRERIAVESITAPTLERLWEKVAALGPSLVVAPDTLAAHYPGDPRRLAVANSATVRKYLPAVERAIHDRVLAYRAADEVLTTQVLSAVAVTSRGDSSLSLSDARSPGPITLARCLVWAVGEAMRPSSPRPVVIAG